MRTLQKNIRYMATVCMSMMMLTGCSDPFHGVQLPSDYEKDYASSSSSNGPDRHSAFLQLWVAKVLGLGQSDVDIQAYRSKDSFRINFRRSSRPNISINLSTVEALKSIKAGPNLEEEIKNAYAAGKKLKKSIAKYEIVFDHSGEEVVNRKAAIGKTLEPKDIIVLLDENWKDIKSETLIEIGDRSCTGEERLFFIPSPTEKLTSKSAAQILEKAELPVEDFVAKVDISPNLSIAAFTYPWSNYAYIPSSDPGFAMMYNTEAEKLHIVGYEGEHGASVMAHGYYQVVIGMNQILTYFRILDFDNIHSEDEVTLENACSQLQ